MLKKVSIPVTALLAAALPAIALAQTAVAPVQKTLFHIIYEKSFGPIGAIAGFIGIIAIWDMSRKVEKNFGFLLKMFVIFIFIINIGSITFGMHGTGILDGQTSRYIERTCRLIALLVANFAALILLAKLGREVKSPNTDQN